jgi:two-component system chemotaxis response regulator CheB
VDYRASLAELGGLLVKLASEEAGPAIDIPDDIRLEVDIALGRIGDSQVIQRLGHPVALSCPACSGVLSQMRQPPLRFRCQVGHAYTADALATASEGTIDEAMRVALRIVEERAVLNEKMAEEARHSGRHAAARASEARAIECRRHAETLQRAISTGTFG